ncbi:magnesium transporter [Corynebacterium imitans]|uniref:magnesium transporter n=1 Tax=Corynebacterium imitans TaxID=156978 RepID=UPI00254D1EA3|nr:magnesium transporter [Corynebacterium imitans]MDK8307287.1 magnesium transporter [Corynebacterium imitans]MDK8636230.1 magnesium transporter [Corynebacterium imitans]MDK8771428.1 magnesium transporter [Corynebacterium imitans]
MIDVAFEREVEAALRSKDVAELSSLLADITPKEAAGLMARMGLQQRALFYRTLPKDVAVTTFDELDPAVQADLVSGLRVPGVAEVFEGMEPDDRAELLDELPASVASRLVADLSEGERELTGIVLGYPEDSIGRRMSPELITLRPTMRVDAALAQVNKHLDDAESIYTLPVVEEDRRLAGVVSLRDLLKAEGDTELAALMQEPDLAVAHEAAEEAARRCADRKRLALPIVDTEDRLVGLLTVDDALRILEEADSEDQARMGGSEPLRRPYLATPVFEIVKSRVVWLLVLAVGATLTVQVLERFEDTLATMVVLSLFVPLLIGTGGNTGNQAATTVTRALALGDVRPGDVLKVVFREARVGILLGVLLGSLGFLIAGFVYGWDIGTVIGLTLVSICTVAATVGGVMPLIGKKLGIDPAVFANPFITTLVDATGLIIYFLIAKSVLEI